MAEAKAILQTNDPSIKNKYFFLKREKQMHKQISHTGTRKTKQAWIPCPQHKRNSLSCPSSFLLGQTRPRLAPSAPSPPWPKTDPALPALACLGGAPPAPSASCQLSTGHRTGKDQFSSQSQRKAMPKNAQTTTQLHSSHMLVK